MDVRPANPEHRSRIREIASDSFRSSYSLSPGQIEAILEERFSDAALADRIDDRDRLFLVAEDELDGEVDVFGFVDVAVAGAETMRWLHVDPTARGQGIATALVERVKEELSDRDASPLEARVLAEAAEGSEFLERIGLERSGNDQMSAGGEEFDVIVFTEGGETEDPNEPAVTVPDAVRVDGAERHVGREDPIPGTKSPFFRTYEDENREEQYGYFCSQCGSTAVTGDGLDRLECEECGNLHRADEWDEAYL